MQSEQQDNNLRERKPVVAGQGRSGNAHHETSAPLGTETKGRLEIASGISRLMLHALPTMPELYRAQFVGPVPDIWAQHGTVTIQYHHRHRHHGSEQRADVTLNGSIPWRITVYGGVSELIAELSDLHLDSLSLDGGTSRAEVTLPQPTDAIPFRMTGGASTVIIHRPRGVAVRVRVSGGVSDFSLDEQHDRNSGENVRRETPSYPDATCRYEIEIVGGASRVIIDAR